jgi:nitrile hydratase beta subunit
MNGPQDLGGMMGFGPIAPERDEPVFHNEWERRAFAVSLAVNPMGSPNIDRVRYERERTPALTYWTANYYEIRIEAHIRLMIANGILSESEIATGHSQARPGKRDVLTAAMVPSVLARGNPANRPADRNQRFSVGDKVRAKNIHPAGHTRLPRYVRGHLGEIMRVHGTHVFPDSNAKGLGEDPQWLYAVSFSARELWGRETIDTVTLDLWEPYLEAAA